MKYGEFKTWVEIEAGSKGESNATKFQWLQWWLGRNLGVLPTNVHLQISGGGLNYTGLLLWGVVQAWQLTQIPRGLAVNKFFCLQVWLPAWPLLISSRARLYATLPKGDEDRLPRGAQPSGLPCIYLLSANCLCILESRKSSLVLREEQGVVRKPEFVLFSYSANFGRFYLLWHHVGCHWPIYFILIINGKWQWQQGRQAGWSA